MLNIQNMHFEFLVQGVHIRILFATLLYPQLGLQDSGLSAIRHEMAVSHPSLASTSFHGLVLYQELCDFASSRWQGAVMRKE